LAVKVVCSYCASDLGEKAPLEERSISHGMCAACHAHFRRQWRGLSLGEYLDAFPCPVIVVDGDARTIAVNGPMADLLGRSSEEVFGLLGGEALECAHARRPGGCGGSVHCRTCAIRNSVTMTLETGEPCLRVPAALERPGGPLRFLVSTHKLGPVVQVVVEAVARPAPDDDGPQTTSGKASLLEREGPGPNPTASG
jgi:PAS domain-containing protein